MLILLLFNQSLQWTVEQIREATQIDSELLIKILYSFFQNKLCTFSQSNDELNLEEKDITLSTSVHLADQYQK